MEAIHQESDAEQAHRGGSVGDLIVAAVRRYPGRIAFIDDDRSIDYAALGERIGRAMAGFQALGLVRGDRVAQISGNRIDVFVVMAAAYLMGLRSVTLHPQGGLDDQIHIVTEAEPSVLICEPELEARAGELRRACPAVGHWFAHGAADGLDDFWQRVEPLAPLPLESSAQPDDVIRLAYTGGTTGHPKGVMLSNRSMWMQAIMIMAARGLPAGGRMLCPTPISHGAGALIVPTLSTGGTFILQRGFDPDRFLDAVIRHRPNAAYLVPTMIYKLLDHERTATADCSSLTRLFYGAAPMSPTRIREALTRFGPILAQSYGQSECPSNILHLTPDDHARTDIDTLGSAGMPYPGVTVALLDDGGRPVAAGAVGELCVRSPLVMDGYWKQPALTAEALRGGWLHTGDMARRDEHGYYHLVDRRKDMVVSGGFNVFPKEVEDVIARHPAVAIAVVIGVPDPLWGEAVKAIVVPRAGMTVDPDELRAMIRHAKGPVCTPKSVDLVESVPMTSLGKPDRKRLREPYWQGRDRAVH